MKKERIVYLDILRIIATVAVVVLHTSASGMSADLLTADWHIANLFNASVQWAVPVFIMISGALFLNPARPLSVRSLYTKNIVRMVTAFFVWSVAYAAVYAVLDLLRSSFSLENAILDVLSGHYHLWFLWMIIGLYAVTPFFRMLCGHKRLTEYFLLLSFVFNILYHTVFDMIVPLFPACTVTAALNAVQSNLATMALNAVMGYSFYFVLGYYLHTNLNSRKQQRILMVLGLLGFGFSCAGTCIATSVTGELTTFYNNLTLGIALEAVGVFALAKYTLSSRSKPLSSFAASLSKWSFGIYLAHALFISLIFMVLPTIKSFSPLLYIPAVSALGFLLSLLVSTVLNKLPFLNRYIV